MKIIIDYNSDRILINPDERFNTAEIEFTKADMRYTLQFAERLLDEIFNGMVGKPNGDLDVQLESLNEDQHKTIGEW